MTSVMTEPREVNWMAKAELLITNAAEVLGLAGEPVTRNTLGQFIEDLPQCSGDLECVSWKDSFCNRCCERAFDNGQSNKCRERVDNLVEYFFMAFVLRPRPIQKRLRECVSKVLGGFEQVA